MIIVLKALSVIQIRKSWEFCVIIIMVILAQLQGKHGNQKYPLCRRLCPVLVSKMVGSF